MAAIINGTKGVTTAGLYTNGTFSDTYSDGIVIDYSSPTGRIIVGTSDGIGFYNNGIASPVSLGSVSSGGAWTMPGDASINGLTVGKGGGAVAGNTALGVSALSGNSTGNASVAVGYQSLRLNTADYSTAIGYQAGYNNTTGTRNTYLGVFTGYYTKTGNDNTYIGYSCGSQVTNTGTSETNNTAVGSSSMQYINTGVSNSALGYGALSQTTSGSYNTAIGQSALNANTTASNNTAVGYQAGFTNSTGTGNVFGGHQAGYTNSTGRYNTFVGRLAGYTSNVNGDAYNTCIGDEAGYSLTTGINNTFIGSGNSYASGGAITTGSKNTIIGAYSGNNGGLDIRTASNYIVLSDGDGNPRGIYNGSYFLTGGATSLSSVGAKITVYGATNQWGLGPTAGNDSFFVYNNGSVGVYLGWGNTSWSSSSDERIKDIIEPIENAAEKVSTLRAVIGKYKTDEDGTRRSFLIAQDVQSVLPEAVNVQDDEQGTLGLQYTDVIPLLVAAIKELKSTVDAQQAEIDALKGAK